MKEIEMYKIYPNKNQPRKNFDEEKIQELADSINKYGLLQPIILKEDSNGEYMIIAGERRFTACKKLGMKKIPAIIKDVSYEEIDKLAIIENLQREDLSPIEAGERRFTACKKLGMKKIPAIIKDVSYEEIDKLAIIENLQREDLSPIEEAKAYRRLIEKYNLTQTQLSESVGKSRPYITNSMRLLNLCEKVLDMLDKGEISSGHGKVLLRVENKDEQERLAKKIVRDKLSVRQLESIVNNMQNKEKKENSKPVYEKDLFVLQAEDTMRNILGTKVNITKGKKSGKIEIEYYSDEDLEAIINMLLAKVNITKGKKSGKIEIEYYSDEDLEAKINMLLGE